MKDGASTLYVQLLKRCLTRTLFPDATWDWNLTRIDPFDPKRREIGQDWPTEAVTMAGMRRWTICRVALRRRCSTRFPAI